MAQDKLQGRNNWQGAAEKNGKTAEQNLVEVFKQEFQNTNYSIVEHPTNLKHLYETVELSQETLSQIFNPSKEAMDRAMIQGWGLTPDFSIVNLKTGKILFGEIKRQDGWVEGKNPNAGRGNAHERMCKLFSPGLINAYRSIGKITDPSIPPFWVVLEGDITRDPKRNREIAFWFDKYDQNYFMWRPGKSGQDLIDHFNKYLKPYLE